MRTKKQTVIHIEDGDDLLIEMDEDTAFWITAGGISIRIRAEYDDTVPRLVIESTMPDILVTDEGLTEYDIPGIDKAKLPLNISVGPQITSVPSIFRKYAKEGENGCDLCPCKAYRGKRDPETGSWALCETPGCAHLAQDHNR